MLKLILGRIVGSHYVDWLINNPGNGSIQSAIEGLAWRGRYWRARSRSTIGMTSSRAGWIRSSRRSRAGRIA